MRKLPEATKREHIVFTDRELLEQAFSAAARSADPSTQTGAAVQPYLSCTLPNMGYNYLPMGVPFEAWNDREQKLRHVVHAEDQVLDVYRDHHDGRIALTWTPCLACAELIVWAGIKKLITWDYPEHDEWPELGIARDYLIERGVAITIIDCPRFREIRFRGEILKGWN